MNKKTKLVSWSEYYCHAPILTFKNIYILFLHLKKYIYLVRGHSGTDPSC